MPAFGKSGTWRIFVFRCSMEWSSDVEPAGAARRVVGDVELVDAGVRRPVAHGVLEPADRLGLALGGDFHAAVVAVADPAGDALARGRVGREVSEPDALDAPAEEISSRHAHRPYDSIRRFVRTSRAWLKSLRSRR